MPDTPQFEMPDLEDVLLARMRADLSLIQADNAAKMAEFARLAGPPGVMGLQVDLLNVRVFTLARMIFGDESHALVQFQLEFERQVAQVLDEVVTKVRQAQLGARMDPQQVSRLLGPNGQPFR